MMIRYTEWFEGLGIVGLSTLLAFGGLFPMCRYRLGSKFGPPLATGQSKVC